MKFYRYKDVIVADIGVRIDLIEFNLVKETPKGYWIKPTWDYDEDFKRWVSKTGKNRKAYPTKEEAMVNFKARKKRQIRILESRLHNAKIALSNVEGMKT